MSVYVITGAARGIGAAMVQQLSAESSNTIFALVRSKSTLIYTPASNVHVVEIGEIGDSESYASTLEKVVKDVEAKAGKVDVLINNAGVMHGDSPRGYVEGDGKLKQFLKDMNENWEVNVLGVRFLNLNACWCTELTIDQANITIFTFLPLLLKSSDPKAVTLSTGLADLEFTRAARFAATAPYSISKAATNMLTAKWAYAYPEIKFLSLSPGYVDSLTRERNDQEKAIDAYLVGEFRKVKPTFNGLITTKESAEACLDVIHHLTREQSGDFLSHHGSKDWL
ncbi:NAD(P)-binding protein [Atractiella rhizophila]|nr:NAD(P)-binding protein [Atractiella rhizophila]